MKYPIDILRERIKVHQNRITELENSDVEMTCDIMFTNEEITGHKDCIEQLQEAVKILMKHG